MRRSLEEAESLQSFLVISSLCGGTGSGFRTSLVEKLKEQYQRKFFTTVNLTNVKGHSDGSLEEYNQVLSLAHVIKDSTLSFFYDNESIYRICT